MIPLPLSGVRDIKQAVLLNTVHKDMKKGGIVVGSRKVDHACYKVGNKSYNKVLKEGNTIRHNGADYKICKSLTVCDGRES